MLHASKCTVISHVLTGLHQSWWSHVVGHNCWPSGASISLECETCLAHGVALWCTFGSKYFQGQLDSSVTASMISGGCLCASACLHVHVHVCVCILRLIAFVPYRCAVCKTHICWLCGVKICQGINNYWDANRHFWIKGTPCYGQIQAAVKWQRFVCWVEWAHAQQRWCAWSDCRSVMWLISGIGSVGCLWV